MKVEFFLTPETDPISRPQSQPPVLERTTTALAAYFRETNVVDFLITETKENTSLDLLLLCQQAS